MKYIKSELDKNPELGLKDRFLMSLINLNVIAMKDVKNDPNAHLCLWLVEGTSIAVLYDSRSKEVWFQYPLLTSLKTEIK
jgi:hypothetical protein